MDDPNPVDQVEKRLRPPDRDARRRRDGGAGVPPSVATALACAGSSRYTILGGTAAIPPVEVPVVCPTERAPTPRRSNGDEEDDEMTERPGGIPPDRAPWDPANGLRVGALVGGLLGAGALWLTGVGWWLPAGAIAGAVVGYWSERRRARRPGPGA